MSTTLRDLSYMIEANTQGLNKAFPALGKLSTNLERLEKSLKALNDRSNTAMNGISRSAQGASKQVARSADQQKAALKRQEAALLSAKNRVIDLNKAVKDTGGNTRLLANNTRAYNVLEKKLKDVKTTSADATLAKAKFSSALSTTRRELKALAAAQRQNESAEKVANMTSLRQAQTLERVRIKYLDLKKAMEGQGRAASDIKALDAAFNGFEARLKSTALSAEDFAKASIDMNAEMARLKRSDGSNTSSLRQVQSLERMRIKYLDLKKAMEDQGRSAADMEALDVAFGGFENRLKSGVLSAEDFAKASIDMNAEMARLKRNDGPSSMTDRLRDLSSTAQVALGPLSGVASRIQAITSVANRSSLALAGFIGGTVAFGTVMTKSILSAADYERQLLKLEGVLESSGNIYGTTVTQLEEIASRVADLTLATGSEAREAAALLQSYGTIPTQFYESILLAAEGISRLSEGDIKDKTKTLAEAFKAPTDNLESLTEATIVLNAAQREEIKTLEASGNLFAAQQKLLEHLAPAIGAATKEVDGMQGAWQEIQDTIKDFTKAAGLGSGSVDLITGFLRELNAELEELLANTKAAESLGKSFKAILTGIKESILFIVQNVETLIDIVKIATGVVILNFLVKFAKSLGVVVTGIHYVVTAIGMVGAGAALTTSAIALLVAGLAYLIFPEPFIAAWNIVKRAIHGAWQGLKDFLGLVEEAQSADIRMRAMEVNADGGAIKKLRASAEKAFAEAVSNSVDQAAIQAMEMATANLVELRDEFLPLVTESKKADEALSKLHATLSSLTGEALAGALEQLGMTQEDLDRLSFILESKLNTSLGKFVHELKNTTAGLEHETKVANASGQAKHELIVEQEVLNNLMSAFPFLTREAAKSLEGLNAEQREQAALIRETTEAMVEAQRQTEQANMARELTDSITLMQTEIALIGQAEIARTEALEIAALKQKMLNASIKEGSEFWNQMIAGARQLNQLDFQKGHIEAVDALEQEALAQQRSLNTLFYSEQTRERMIALDEKRNELLRKYGSLQDEQAKKELALFKLLQERNKVLEQWEEVADVVDNAFQGLEDTIVNAAKTGKFEWKEFIGSILSDILRLNVRRILEPIHDWLGGKLQGMFGGVFKGSMPELSGTDLLYKVPLPVTVVGGLGSAQGMFGRVFGEGEGASVGDVVRAPLGDIAGSEISRGVVDLGNGINMTVDAFEHKMDLIAKETARTQDLIQDRINKAFGSNVSPFEVGQQRIQERIDAAFGGSGSIIPDIQKNIQNRIDSAFKGIEKTVSSAFGKTSIVDYIQQSALRHGIDPSIALRVAKSEGGVTDFIQSNFFKNGIREPSYGPFQLLKGGPGTGFPAGLGNDFMRATGLDPANPNSLFPGIDFAMQHAAKNGWGAWYGAKNVGIGNWEGIGAFPPSGAPASSFGGSMVPSGVQIPGAIPEGAFGGGLGAGDMGLGSLSQGVQQATESFSNLNTGITDTVSSLTSSFDTVKTSVDGLATSSIPKVTQSLDTLATDGLTKSVQSQVVAATQTAQMGTSSTVASAQIQQLGASASAASAQISTSGGGGGGILGSIGKLFGFASGGFTGGGDPSKVAGVVHEKEFVFDANSTKRIGVATLENIRREARRGSSLRDFKRPRVRLRSGGKAEAFSAGDQGQNQTASMADRMKIINVLDKNIVGDYLATDEGEKLVINVLRRNGYA